MIFKYNKYSSKDGIWYPSQEEIQNAEKLIDEAVIVLNKLEFEISEEGNIDRKMRFDSDNLLKPTKFKINCVSHDMRYYDWLFMPDRYEDDIFVMIKYKTGIYDGARDFIVFRILDDKNRDLENYNKSTSKKITYANHTFYCTLLPKLNQAWSWDSRNVGSFFLINHVFGSWVSHRDAAGSEINTIDLNQKELKHFIHIYGPGNYFHCGVHQGQWLFFDVYHRNTDIPIKYAGLNLISNNPKEFRWCLLEKWNDHLHFNKFQIF